MSFEIKNGDLLNCDIQYIAHQCNCLSRSGKGLAKAIFDKYPYANVYYPRNRVKHLPLDDEQPGMFKVMGNGTDKRYIINIFSQISPSPPSDPNCPKDGFKARLNMFVKALKEIAKIEGLKSIAFPWRYGCGLAGGNWDTYQEVIRQFSVHVGDDVKVYIIKPPGEK